MKVIDKNKMLKIFNRGLQVFLLLLLLIAFTSTSFAYNTQTEQASCYYGRSTASMTALNVQSQPLAAGDSFFLVETATNLVSIFQLRDSGATANNIDVFTPAGTAGTLRWHFLPYNRSVSSPIIMIYDSDCAGTDLADKEVVAIEANATTTTEDHEVGDLIFNVMLDGTRTPVATFDGSATSWLTAYDVEITSASKGIILRDTNGVRYRITVSTDGELTATSL